MPLISSSLATPKPPVRPTPLNTAISSTRRRRSRSSGGVVGCVSGCCGGIAVGDSKALKEQPNTPQPPPAPSQNVQLKQFAAAMTRPADSAAALRNFELLRSLLPRRFAELCKVHLSFVIDVPADFLDDADVGDQDRPAGQWLWQRARDSMKLKRSQCGAVSAPPPSSVDDFAAVDRLLTQLARRPGIERVEGLFRKCGSVVRQRRILDGLLAGNDIAADVSEAWTPHDLAGALKASLARLSEPLLTRRLLPYFQQVARLGVHRTTETCVADEADNDGLLAVLTARRLKALRLLVQLLPPDRRVLLGRLLSLLARVADAAAASRMTPESLGTVFGPALLYPTAEAGEREQAAGLNSALAFVIRHADAVMQVPDSVAQDADGILRRLRRCRGAAAADETAMPCLSVRFAESADVAVDIVAADADDFTRSQVAALYAAVQAMPDSAKRRRLIRRFNRTNGGLPTTSVASATTVSVYSPSSSAASPSVSSPVFGRLFDFPMRCLSPEAGQ